MPVGLLGYAFIMGVLISLQGPINGSLQRSIGSTPLLAALVSSFGSMAFLAVAAAATGERWTGLGRLGGVAPWQLTGGLIGAFFIFGLTMLAPRIGVATTMSLVVGGQLVGSLVLDWIGVAGLTVRDLTTARVGGVALAVLGILLVNFGDRFRSTP